MRTRVRKLTGYHLSALHMAGIDTVKVGETYVEFAGDPDEIRAPMWEFINRARSRNGGRDTYWSKGLLRVAVQLGDAVTPLKTAPAGRRIKLTEFVTVFRTAE